MDRSNAAMPCPPHRVPDTTASIAIGHSRSGVTKSQISGTIEMPKEQTTSTGRAPRVSTRRPHAGADTMRRAATMTAWAATSMNAISRLASMWNEKKPAEIPTAAPQPRR